MSAATTKAAANAAASTVRWKLYGLPLSQPFRSVAWVLLQKKIRFSIQLAVPGSDSSKNGCRHENYKAKSRMRTTRIPLLEDTLTGFTIAESPAIMTYLCENYIDETTDTATDASESSSSMLLYAPMGSTKKATIDSYLHFHHTGTRQLAALAYPFMRGNLGGESSLTNDEKEKQNRRRTRVMDTLQQLEDGWFANMSSDELDNVTNNDDDLDLYLAGGTSPTIADVLAYEEFTQLTYTKLLDKQLLHTNYPSIFSWMQRMQQVPFHDEVHAALTSLGDVTVPDANNTPFLKRLGSANKKGIQVLNEAQSDFPREDERERKLSNQSKL